MPIIYLSPSTQEWNYYVNGGTEEEWMNLLADKMIPYLGRLRHPIARNTPDMTGRLRLVAPPTREHTIFHVALHSQTPPP